MDNVFELEALYPNSMQDTYIKGQMANNMNKNFVQRIMQGTDNTVLNNKNMDGSRSTHSMASGDSYMFPLIVNNGKGSLSRNYRGSGEGIKLPNDNMAQWLGMNYKRANPEMFNGKPALSMSGGY